MGTRRTGRPLLVYVAALAAAMTLPPLGLAIVTTSRWVVAERAGLETAAREIADDAMLQVDRYLSGKIAMLQALATSPALDAGDFQRLDAQARELLDLQEANIVLRELSGQQLVNTRRPWGTPLPRVPNFEADAEVAAYKLPYVTGLYEGVMAGGPLIRVIVPVIRAGEVAYTLTASLPPSALSRLLREAGIAPPYVGSIADRTGSILARTLHDQALIGKPIGGFATLTGDKGVWSGTDPEGERIYGAFRRSPLSGWVFTIGISMEVLNAPLRRSMLWLALTAIVLGLLAFGVSMFIAGRMIRSHRQVAETAEALGNGHVVDPPRTHLREANLIGEALAAASVKLHQQAAAVVAANRDLEHRVQERTREVSTQAQLIHATLDNMDQGLIVVDADGTIPIYNQRVLELLDLPVELMRSRPTFEAVRRHQLGADDFARSDETVRDWVAGGGLERRLHTYERERPNGVVLEIRTVPLDDGGAVRTYTDITARKEAERVAQHMARHDPLTGLPNRTLFRERLTQELASVARRGGSFSLLYLDLDRFKSVNDTFGHPAGDALLRLVADRIRSVLRVEDMVARLAGDEFAVLQLTDAQPHGAGTLADRLIEAIDRPFDLGGRVVSVGISIGIAVAPRDGADADQLLKSADLALYRAKDEGRNRARFYEAAMDVAVQSRQSLEFDLRSALERCEFEIHYQPVVRIADGVVTACEALLRWRHPTRGMISPVDFISLAEETGLIVPIGAWVLREACREATMWPLETRVSVNISPLQMEDPGLVGSVLSALASAELPPNRLQLEITESVFMRESEPVMRVLADLRGCGIRFALDDFGTGYSSLSYLQTFRLDGLKIDRSFTAGLENPTTAAIVSAIIGLGRGLDIAVTAEGVETAEQLEHLRRAGCTEVQGYLFSRPVPVAEARLYLRDAVRARAA